MHMTLGVACIAALALAGSCLAGGSAHHHVSISIPGVLRLRIDGRVASDHADVPVSVHIDGSHRDIEPSSTRLEVFANTAWQLSVSSTAVGGEADLVLSWQVQGSGALLNARPSHVESGLATHGWHTIDVTYGVVNAPFDGHYQVVIAYTLARP